MAGKMAAAELKHDNASPYGIVKRNVSTITLHREIECYEFRLFDLFYYLTSVTFFFVDIATDNIIFMEYFLQGQFIWGCFALSFTILPAGVIQMFSLRWYHSDGSIRNIHWLLHFLFLGVLHRYLVLLYSTIYSLRSKRFAKDKNWVYRQESDICMLHLFESFMGAAPQLVLQLYVMAVLRCTPLWTSLSAIVSFCSLSWAIGTYTKAMHKINLGRNEATWVVLTLQGLWRAGMLISRIAVLVLTVICLKEWSLLFLGLHWLFMTVWVILQNTDFCPTIWEERLYNCIIGIIYCFDFFNLRVGKSRYRVLIFYAVIVTENIVFLVVYVICFKDAMKAEEITIMISLIIGGMMIGLTSMLLYYGKFHPARKGDASDSTDKRSSEIATDKAVTPRSFKQRYYPSSFASSTCSVDHSHVTTADEITTDKQFLLTNIVQNVECTENGIVNQNCKTESESQAAICVVSEYESAHSKFSKDESTSSAGLRKNAFLVNDECVEIQNNSNDSTENDIHRKKRRGICLPTRHDLDIDNDVSTKESNSSVPLQKRRGICFSNQIILEMEKGERETDTICRNLVADVRSKAGESQDCSRDNIHNDLNCISTLRGRLRTPAIFSDACEKTVPGAEKLAKDLQHRDDTMSCVTSIHDYENVCPLGVARPPWCIRSWKGYTDIETYIHDDSVVRDRRRDTLTSTTTGTTFSSEFSDTTCTSSILRGILKQDDYLDTLTYDLIDSRELKTAYTEDLSAKRITDIDEQSRTLYIAKPVVIDDKGGMLALDTIAEEHDEINSDEMFEYTRPVRDSASTLVSTIDQIRKYTAENSPRHVYHTTGSQWEDFDPKNLIKKAQLTRALFREDLKDSVACDRSYIDCSGESEAIVRGKCEMDVIKDLVKYCTIESIRKTPLIDAILSDSPILGNKDKLQKQAAVTCRSVGRGSKENDLYVEMSPLVPAENITVVHNNFTEATPSDNIGVNSMDAKRAGIASDVSTQSAQKSKSDDEERLRLSVERYRKPINYPKWKFSLLREKFESKSQLVYVVTPHNVVQIGQSALSSEIDASRKDVSTSPRKSSDSTRQDKENLAPMASLNIDKSHEVDETDKSLCSNDVNFKERRHIFLEQVLSPPKLFTWNRRRRSLAGSPVKKA